LSAVLLLHGCSFDEATRALDRAGGRLRTALKHLGDVATSAVLANEEELSPGVQAAGDDQNHMGEDNQNSGRKRKDHVGAQGVSLKTIPRFAVLDTGRARSGLRDQRK
jgi:hypothetical protein